MLIGGASVHVRLPPTIMKKITTLAAKDEVTVSEWIRRCILTFVTGKDDAMRSQLDRAMEPFLPMIGEAFGQALEKAVSEDPQLPRKIENALDRAVKNWAQQLRSENVIPAKESNSGKEAAPD